MSRGGFGVHGAWPVDQPPAGRFQAGRSRSKAEPGAGSSFSLCAARVGCPLEARRQAAAPVRTCDLLKASRHPLAEDHGYHRMLVSEMLDRCGQEVALAHDRNEAIAMVIDSIMRGPSFDLVLMDVQMQGARLCREPFAMPRRRDGNRICCLVVALTRQCISRVYSAAQRWGACRPHLAKTGGVRRSRPPRCNAWLPTSLCRNARGRRAAPDLSARRPPARPPPCRPGWSRAGRRAVRAGRGRCAPPCRRHAGASCPARMRLCDRIMRLAHKCFQASADKFGEAALVKAPAVAGAWRWRPVQVAPISARRWPVKFARNRPIPPPTAVESHKADRGGGA